MLENWKSHIFLCAHIILELLSTFFTSCWLWWSHASTKQNKSKQGCPRNSSYKLHKSECSTYIACTSWQDWLTYLFVNGDSRPTWNISLVLCHATKQQLCLQRQQRLLDQDFANLSPLHLANCFCFFNFQPNHPPKTGDFFLFSASQPFSATPMFSRGLHLAGPQGMSQWRQLRWPVMRLTFLSVYPGSL